MIRHASLWRVPVFFLAASVLYATVSMVRHLAFGSSMDLAIFHQALTSGAPTPFETLIKGPGRSIFGDHFHPLILVCWPLLAVFPSPVTLLVAQSLSLAAAVTMLCRRLWRSATGPRWLVWAVVLSPGVQGAVGYDFHEVSLGAPLVVGWALLMARRGGWRATLVALSVLLVKEDAALLVVGMAWVHLIRGERRVAAILATTSALWWLFVTRMVIPRLAHGQYTYTELLPTEGAVVVQRVTEAFLVPGLATVTLVVLVASLGFLPLRSALAWAPVPQMIAYGLTGNFRHQTFYYHYYALPSLLLAAAAVDAVSRGFGSPWTTHRTVSRIRSALTAVVLIATLVAGPLTVALWRVDGTKRSEGIAATSTVPDGVEVATDPALAAHLTGRTRVTLLTPCVIAELPSCPEVQATWALVDLQTMSFGGNQWVGQVVEGLVRQGFRLESRHGRFLVMRR